MKSIWTSLLVKVVGYLTSGDFIKLVKELVHSMIVDEGKTGEEKRAFVLNELKKSAFEFGSNLAGLAIEAVVALAKAKGAEALK